MSRNRIPPVRLWCVRYYDGRDLVGSEIVETINKRFARWIAAERNRMRAFTYRATVSLLNPTLQHRSKRHVVESGSDRRQFRPMVRQWFALCHTRASANVCC